MVSWPRSGAALLLTVWVSLPDFVRWPTDLSLRLVATPQRYLLWRLRNGIYCASARSRRPSRWGARSKYSRTSEYRAIQLDHLEHSPHRSTHVPTPALCEATRSQPLTHNPYPPVFGHARPFVPCSSKRQTAAALFLSPAADLTAGTTRSRSVGPRSLSTDLRISARFVPKTSLL